MSDLSFRLLILRKLIRMGGEGLHWLGNIAIQKLVYLLENVYKVDLGYTYGLHHLGPYSFELAGDLSLGEQADLWRSKTIQVESPFKSYHGMQYEICEDSGIPYEIRADVQGRWEQVEPAMKALLSAIGRCTGRDLELYATIHYLRTVQDVPEEDLWDVLHILKPKYSLDEFDKGKEKLKVIENDAKAHFTAAQSTPV